MRKIAIAGLALLAAACSSTKTVTQTTDTVSYSIDDRRKDLSRATEKAQEHCKKQGKVAKLESTEKVGRNGRVVTFKCVSS